MPGMSDEKRMRKFFPFALEKGKGKAGMVFVCKSECYYLDRVWHVGENHRAGSAAAAERVPRHFVLKGSPEAEKVMEDLKPKPSVSKVAGGKEEPLSELEDSDLQA